MAQLSLLSGPLSHLPVQHPVTSALKAIVVFSMSIIAVEDVNAASLPQETVTLILHFVL